MKTAGGPGQVVVVSGPSGAGKTTVLREVFQRSQLPLVHSVSATTRPPREGEADGIHYHFLTPDEFHARRRRGEFIETFEVFGRGYWYGTLRAEVTSGLQAGKWVGLEIDVHVAMEVVLHYPDAITIFIRPGSLEELERRLRHRATETEDALRRRLQTAQEEIALSDRYRYVVINDQIGRAVEEICGILQREFETGGLA